MSNDNERVRRVSLIGGKEPIALMNNINDWLAEHSTQNPRVITININEGWCRAWIEYDKRIVP